MEDAARLTRAIREALIAHSEEASGHVQWYIDEFTIDCDAEEFWNATEQAIDRALADG